METVNHTGLNQPGGNQSDKFLAFVPGVPQRQLHEILRRALDFGWTCGLTPLELQGQSTQEENKFAFSSPKQIVFSFKFGENSDVYGTDAFRLKKALTAVRNLWNGKRVVSNVRSCIICTNVAASGITSPDAGVVISSGFSIVSLFRTGVAFIQ